MKIAVISGSHRKNSESLRVAEYVSGRIAQTGAAETQIISLSGNPLPLWDEGTWAGDPRWKELWGPVSSKLKEADGLVVISPEWGGMVPAGLKNLFLLCGAGEVAHKAGLIVAVSSGIGGSYPVAELRASSYKNSRICYIPDHVIVRQSEQMLKGDTPQSPHDESIRKIIDYSVKVLIEYTKALKGIRESGVLDYKSFPFGM